MKLSRHLIAALLVAALLNGLVFAEETMKETVKVPEALPAGAQVVGAGGAAGEGGAGGAV